MHPSHHARTRPHSIAFVMAGSGVSMSYGELDRRANQVAQLLRTGGVARGDCVAIFLENVPAYFEIMWGCQRAGVYAVPISAKLLTDELAYILADSGSRILFYSASLSSVARAAAGASPGLTAIAVEAEGGDYEALRETMPCVPIADPSSGAQMLYSSGTTGRPKGIRPPLPETAVDAPTSMMNHASIRYGMDAETVYLSPAPLYHAAPLRWSMAVQGLGGTVVVMERFGAEDILALIERHQVTHGQFVPTHFSRLLALPDDVRSRYSLASLRAAVHAAAPCPVHVKEAMIAWWGPIIHEYYAGSESNGITVASPGEWLAHKGTVGKAFGCEVHICDDDGNLLPVGSEGTIYFAGGASFEYHNDPEKTAESRNSRGWTTMGDVGRLDEDGFLYLTDRKSFMIISGGVNIYPQEIENLLLAHPRVADAAVVGAPHDDLGEVVVAVIQPREWEGTDASFAGELHAYLRERLSHVKAPKRIDFMRELPRLPTGKLMKRLLQDSYRGANDVLAAEIVSGG